MKRSRLTGIQYAALPWRAVGRQIQILLVTSRRTRRWVIPKGWPMRGLKPHEAAALEAEEEAGVTGEVSDTPLGSFRYIKILDEDRAMAVQVIVFPLDVQGQSEGFKEAGQRNLRWLDYHEAAQRVAEPSLKHLIREFGRAHSPGFLMRGWRAYRSWRIQRPA